MHTRHTQPPMQPYCGLGTVSTHTLPRRRRSKQVRATTPAGLSAAAPWLVCTYLWVLCNASTAVSEGMWLEGSQQAKAGCLQFTAAALVSVLTQQCTPLLLSSTHPQAACCPPSFQAVVELHCSQKRFRPFSFKENKLLLGSMEEYQTTGVGARYSKPPVSLVITRSKQRSAKETHCRLEVTGRWTEPGSPDSATLALRGFVQQSV